MTRSMLVSLCYCLTKIQAAAAAEAGSRAICWGGGPETRCRHVFSPSAPTAKSLGKVQKSVDAKPTYAAAQAGG